MSNKVSESTGTVLACVNYRKNYLPRNNVCIAPGLDDGCYFQMAFDENGATVLEWYRDKYALGSSIPELLEMAALVDVGCGGLIAKPCAHVFSEKSGFENIKEQIHHGYFVRAILEST